MRSSVRVESLSSTVGTSSRSASLDWYFDWSPAEDLGRSAKQNLADRGQRLSEVSFRFGMCSLRKDIEVFRRAGMCVEVLDGSCCSRQKRHLLQSPAAMICLAPGVYRQSNSEYCAPVIRSGRCFDLPKPIPKELQRPPSHWERIRSDLKHRTLNTHDLRESYSTMQDP